MLDPWTLGDLKLSSRVLLGSAQYPSTQVFLDALDASGAELVTVAMRRVRPGPGENVFALLAERNRKLLPNTAGCHTADEAVKTAELAREALGTNLVKLEVIGDEDTLLPDTQELLRGAQRLVNAGFQVLPYTNDDPIVAQRLQDVGCVAVMPLAAPIGSGLGIRNPHNLEMIRARIQVPVIVDAGIGTASDVTLAMELGMDAVLLNSAVSRARDPVAMARAVRLAAEAGRYAIQAGRMPKKRFAESASPLDGRAFT